MEDNTKPSWISDAIKKGLILGLIHAIVFVIIYSVVPNKLTGFSYLFIILLINIGYGSYTGIQWRNNATGGYLSYGAAFKYAFVMLAFNGIVGTLFTAVFLLVDPNLPETFAQAQLDTSVYWAQKFGAPQEALDKVRDDFNPEDITKRFTPVGMLTGYGIGLIFYAIGALIIGLFVRKNIPETF